MSSPYSMLKHITAHLRKCKISRAELNDISYLKDQFSKALDACNTRIIKIDGHSFQPEGVTVIAILADSHAVLHTWPEESFVMAEIFTCGTRADPMAGIKILIEMFKPLVQEVQDSRAKI